MVFAQKGLDVENMINDIGIKILRANVMGIKLRCLLNI